MLELLRLALPMVVSQGAFAMMIFTDRYFMSQIDPAHMAAALGGGVASFFSFCFFTGVLSYGNAMAAQYLGAGEREKCPKVVTQGMIMTLMSLPILTLITFLVAGIFEGMGHEPAQVALERTYYLILMSGVLVTLAKVCISSYFAGIGRTHVVMICDVFGLAVNVPVTLATQAAFAAGEDPVMDAAFEVIARLSDPKRKLVASPYIWTAAATVEQKEVSIENSAIYVASFSEDGSYALQADCNRLTGNWTLEDDILTLGPAAATAAVCPGNSQGEDFARMMLGRHQITFDGDKLVVIAQDEKYLVIQLEPKQD